ncbi:hypothetical protein MFLAVUS_003726 [Mucor flavus]|uniref:Uncharacterized protein n=1 Tax=Mucor flavus TaxID=439312 RepID=A0ABP9YU04_9FUNG
MSLISFLFHSILDSLELAGLVPVSLVNGDPTVAFAIRIKKSKMEPWRYKEFNSSKRKEIEEEEEYESSLQVSIPQSKRAVLDLVKLIMPPQPITDVTDQMFLTESDIFKIVETKSDIKAEKVTIEKSITLQAKKLAYKCLCESVFASYKSNADQPINERDSNKKGKSCHEIIKGDCQGNSYNKQFQRNEDVAEAKAENVLGGYLTHFPPLLRQHAELSLRNFGKIDTNGPQEFHPSGLNIKYVDIPTRFFNH